MTRRYDIDWLRIVATLLLFVFHAGMIFSPAPFYHVRNAELSTTLLYRCNVLSELLTSLSARFAPILCSS